MLFNFFAIILVIQLMVFLIIHKSRGWTSIIDDDYYSSIEKIKVKSKNREEVRFELYKDTFKMERQFIPRSLDLTEKQLLELIGKAIEGKVLSEEFVNLLREKLNKI